MTAMLASVEFDRQDRISIAVLSGEIDISNTEHIRRQIFDSITNDDVAVVVDLSALTFIDSSGLHTLFELQVVLREHDQQLVLVVPPTGQPARTIEIVGMPQVISTYEDRAAALKAVAQIQR